MRTLLSPSDESLSMGWVTPDLLKRVLFVPPNRTGAQLPGLPTKPPSARPNTRGEHGSVAPRRRPANRGALLGSALPLRGQEAFEISKHGMPRKHAIDARALTFLSSSQLASAPS